MRVGRAATACGCRSTIGCPARGSSLRLDHRSRRARARQQLSTACARRQAIASMTETASQTHQARDRLAACAYCRRLFDSALQNELRVICLTAQALLRPRTERNLAVMKFKFPPRVLCTIATRQPHAWLRPRSPRVGEGAAAGPFFPCRIAAPPAQQPSLLPRQPCPTRSCPARRAIILPTAAGTAPLPRVLHAPRGTAGQRRPRSATGDRQRD